MGTVVGGIKYYKLVNREPVECSFQEACELEMWKSDDRIIEQTKIGEILISTVFLGSGYTYGGLPQLFETMVFGEELDNCCWRYYDWQGALQGHFRVVKTIKLNAAVQEMVSS